MNYRAIVYMNSFLGPHVQYQATQSPSMDEGGVQKVPLH